MLLTGQCLHSLYSRTSMLVCDPRDKHVVHAIHVKFIILLQLSLYRHTIHYLFFNKTSDCYAAIWALFTFSTLFSKRSAHWFHQVLPVTPGHWPLPQVISSLSKTCIIEGRGNLSVSNFWITWGPRPPTYWVLTRKQSVWFHVCIGEPCEGAF